MQHHNNNFYKYIALLVTIVYSILFFLISSKYSGEYNTIGLILCAFFSCIIFKDIKRVPVRPSTIFLIAFLIVNCQLYLDLLLEYTTTESIFFVNPNTINKGITLSVISFAAFSFGYLNVSSPFKSKVKEYIGDKEYRCYIIINLICFIIWLTTLTKADFSGANYSGSGAYNNTTTVYTEIFYRITFITALAGFAKRTNEIRDIKKLLLMLPRVFVFTSMVYVVIKLMSGDRGGALLTLCAFFFFFIFMTKIKLKLIVMLPAILAFALIFTSISLTRNFGNKYSFTEKLTYALDNQDILSKSRNSISPFTQELSRSIWSNHVALNEIENKNEDYHLGAFHFAYTCFMVPFAGSKIINDYLGVSSKDRSSSSYVTIAALGNDYGYGLGTSTIADNYLEFGIFSVIIACIILGAIYKKVDLSLLMRNGNNLSMGAILFCFIISYAAISIPRAYFFFYLKEFVWAYLYYKFIHLCFRKKSI